MLRERSRARRRARAAVRAQPPPQACKAGFFCCCAALARVQRLQSGMADLDTVISLSIKARELVNKSHYERSVHKWRAALAAAEALGAEDCIIVASLMVKAARFSLIAENFRGVPVTQAFVLEAFAQYAASAAILRRRRDAGTLLQPMCRPAEMRWKMEIIRGEFHDRVDTLSDAEMLPMASLVGYDAPLDVCCACTELVQAAMELRVLTPELERTLLSFTCNCWDEAVALMIQPRTANHLRSNAEGGTYLRIEMLKRVLTTGEAQHQIWYTRVSVALARLQQSGVLQERGLGGADFTRKWALAQQNLDCSAQRRRQAAASGQLRTCALAGCGATEAHPSHFSKCGACKAVMYCCKQHQQADWPAHKAACKEARTADG